MTPAKFGKLFASVLHQNFEKNIVAQRKAMEGERIIARQYATRGHKVCINISRVMSHTHQNKSHAWYVTQPTPHEQIQASVLLL